MAGGAVVGAPVMEPMEVLQRRRPGGTGTGESTMSAESWTSGAAPALLALVAPVTMLAVDPAGWFPFGPPKWLAVAEGPGRHAPLITDPPPAWR